MTLEFEILLVQRKVSYSDKYYNLIISNYLMKNGTERNNFKLLI